MVLLEYVRIIVGLPMVLFIPGYALTKALFPGKELDWVEQLTLGFALSIASVPLLILYMNQLLGIKITVWSSLGAVGFITLAGLLVWLGRVKSRK